MYIPSHGEIFDSRLCAETWFQFHLIFFVDFFIYVLGGRVSICLFCVEKFNLLGLMDYHFHFLLIRFSDRISPFSVPSSWSKNTKNIEFLKIRPGIILIDVTNLFYILWPKFDSVKDLTSFEEYRVRRVFFTEIWIKKLTSSRACS